MSTLVDFVPSSITAFSFQAALSDGNQYNITVPWNIFGENYYVNVSDLFGNVIVHKSLISSGPNLQALFTWNNAVATAVTTLPHNVPIGSLANVNISQTDSGFDGDVQALSTGTNTMTYSLMVDPNEVMPLTGNVNFNINLVAGYLNASLIFNKATNQFSF